jgi:hypothetical protein
VPVGPLKTSIHRAVSLGDWLAALDVGQPRLCLPKASGYLALPQACTAAFGDQEGDQGTVEVCGALLLHSPDVACACGEA